MYVMGNKQINLALVELVEFLEDPVDAPHPTDPSITQAYAFDVRMSSGITERFLYATEEERQAKWEKFIDAIESEARGEDYNGERVSP